MHGLVARTLQCFIQDTYGEERWRRVADDARLELPEFEAMLDYEAQLIGRVLTRAELELDKPRAAMLEDIGTYLMTHPNNERLRRLMRYGGEDFIDFLHSLEELPGRARLAVPDLSLPALELSETAPRRFALVCKCTGPTSRGYSHVLAGVLRAMADDYGALILLDLADGPGDDELIEITVIETAYTRGRSFVLGAHGAGQGG